MAPSPYKLYREKIKRFRIARLRHFILAQQWTVLVFYATILDYIKDELAAKSRKIKILNSPICQLWWKKALEEWDNKQWINHFSMSKEAFMHLSNILKDHLVRSSWFRSVDIQLRIAITLWKLSTNVDYDSIGQLFAITKETVYFIIKEVIDVILEKLLKVYIKMPTNDDLDNVIQGFQDKLKIPQCAGIIGGMHIEVNSSMINSIEFLNSNQTHSIILQAVIGHKGQFTDIFVGSPGSQRYSDTLIKSPLYRKGQNNSLFPDGKRTVKDLDIPLTLVGDANYPLLNWLMTPYKNKESLLPEQVLYNEKLSGAQTMLSNTFKLLKARWNCLLEKTFDSEFAAKITAVCCILHNFCKISNQDIAAERLSEIKDEPKICPSELIVISGEDIRKVLTQYYSTKPEV